MSPSEPNPTEERRGFGERQGGAGQFIGRAQGKRLLGAFWR